MELAKAVGVEPKSVNFVTYDGGGDLLTALLGKKITVGTSSPGELIDQIEAGQLRVLAVSSDERVEGHRRPDAERGRNRHDIRQLARSPCAAGHFRRRQAGRW